MKSFVVVDVAFIRILAIEDENMNEKLWQECKALLCKPIELKGCLFWHWRWRQFGMLMNVWSQESISQK